MWSAGYIFLFFPLKQLSCWITEPHILAVIAFLGNGPTGTAFRLIHMYFVLSFFVRWASLSSSSQPFDVFTSSYLTSQSMKRLTLPPVTKRLTAFLHPLEPRRSLEPKQMERGLRRDEDIPTNHWPLDPGVPSFSRCISPWRGPGEIPLCLGTLNVFDWLPERVSHYNTHY